MSDLRRWMWGGMIGVLLLSACKNQEEFDCEWEGIESRSAPRQAEERAFLTARRENGRWRPDQLLQVRKWRDRGRDPELFIRSVADRFLMTEWGILRSVPVSPNGSADFFGREDVLARSTLAVEIFSPSDREARGAQVVRVSPAEKAAYRTPEGLSAEFPIEAVHWSGDPRFRLNLVILPDGFTADQMENYRYKTRLMVEELLSKHRPYSDYRDLINVIRVDLPSRESGADCDDLKYSPRANRYGSSFPVACLNALVGTKFNDRFIYQLNAARVLRESNQIFYDGVSVADEVYILVNSKKSGGTAILWGTQTTASSWSVAAHEMGHSWGRLADEYLVKGDLCHLYMATAPNLSTRKTSVMDVKWRQWIELDTPIPTPADDDRFARAVGLFQGGAGGCRRSLYRPRRTCKMDSSREEFCPVCMEQMILRIYDRANPIQGPLRWESGRITAPIALGERMRTRWYVDDRLVQETLGYAPLANFPQGGREVRLVVFDENAPVRKDRCDLVFGARAMID